MLKRANCELFEPVRGAKILVIGDVMIDRYIHGSSGRLSPEHPVPLVNVSSTNDIPGGAANVAMNIAALGADVELVGVVGEDGNADVLQNLLENAGVRCHFSRQKKMSTKTIVRLEAHSQELVRFDTEGDPLDVDCRPISEYFDGLITSMNMLILADYDRGALNDVKHYISRARELDITVVVDPFEGSAVNYHQYARANILTPNLQELRGVIGPFTDDTDLIAKTQHLAISLNLDGILITRSENGMTFVDSKVDQKAFNLKPQASRVVNPIGAGDTVVAALAVGLASAYPLRKALEFSNFAAGFVVEHQGTCQITVNDFNDYIKLKSRELTPDLSSKLVTQDEALRIVKKANSSNETVVFTNGCFDILHAGHVLFLQKAKQLGSCLVIAVNDDDSVRRLKGQGRPVTTLNDRMTVLAALTSSDWICSFSEDTPELLIEMIKPDVLVKGSDYAVENIVGAEFVRGYGGKVETVELTPNCSTTKIIKKAGNGSTKVDF